MSHLPTLTTSETYTENYTQYSDSGTFRTYYLSHTPGQELIRAGHELSIKTNLGRTITLAAYTLEIRNKITGSIVQTPDLLTNKFVNLKLSVNLSAGTYEIRLKCVVLITWWASAKTRYTFSRHHMYYRLYYPPITNKNLRIVGQEALFPCTSSRNSIRILAVKK